MNKAHSKSFVKQSGFTMIEMSIAIIILVIIISISASVFFNQQNNSRLTESAALIERDLINGINTCKMKLSTYSRCGHQAGDENSYIAMEGVNILTPWGEAWSMTVDGPMFRLRWPINSVENARELETILLNSKGQYIHDTGVDNRVLIVILKMP